MVTAVNTFVAIVPAAGIGSRMKSSVAKQYLRIGDKTVIEHTLEALLSHAQIQDIIVVLHPQDRIFQSLAIAANPLIKVVLGGRQRVDSVLMGLSHCLSEQLASPSSWVLVHDAARPCVTHSELNDLFASVNDGDGAILAVPVTDTLKLAAPNKETHASEIQQTVDRTQLWHAQTPQIFPLKRLIDAIKKAQRDGISITDEASAMEHAQANVKLIHGRSTNIKITHPSDLALAAFYLSTDVLTNNDINNKQGGTRCSV